MNITKIKSAGINYDEGLARFANKPELYQKYLLKFFDDPGFSELGRYLEEKNDAEAFKAAHTLKGMAGNLSMTDFYRTICDLVERLRNHQIEGTEKLYAQLLEIYNRAKEAIMP